MLPFLIMLEEQSTGFLAPLLLHLVPPNSYTFDPLGLEGKTMFCFKDSYGALRTALNASSVLNCLLIGTSDRDEDRTPKAFQRDGLPGDAVLFGPLVGRKPHLLQGIHAKIPLLRQM